MSASLLKLIAIAFATSAMEQTSLPSADSDSDSTELKPLLNLLTNEDERAEVASESVFSDHSQTQIHATPRATPRQLPHRAQTPPINADGAMSVNGEFKPSTPRVLSRPRTLTPPEKSLRAAAPPRHRGWETPLDAHCRVIDDQHPKLEQIQRHHKKIKGLKVAPLSWYSTYDLKDIVAINNKIKDANFLQYLNETGDPYNEMFAQQNILSKRDQTYAQIQKKHLNANASKQQRFDRKVKKSGMSPHQMFRRTKVTKQTVSGLIGVGGNINCT